MIPKKPKKPKTPKLSSIVNKADTVCSVYVRMKFSDYAGCITCITCGKYLPWKEAHNAHWIERGKYGVRWNEYNVHPACSGCNVFNKQFHDREYGIYMLDHYGREKMDELRKEARRLLKPSEKRDLALEAIDRFTEAIKAL